MTSTTRIESFDQVPAALRDTVKDKTKSQVLHAITEMEKIKDGHTFSINPLLQKKLLNMAKPNHDDGWWKKAERFKNM